MIPMPLRIVLLPTNDRVIFYMVTKYIRNGKTTIILLHKSFFFLRYVCDTQNLQTNLA